MFFLRGKFLLMQARTTEIYWGLIFFVESQSIHSGFVLGDHRAKGRGRTASDVDMMEVTSLRGESAHCPPTDKPFDILGY
jgi:hypothetical protein